MSAKCYVVVIVVDRCRLKSTYKTAIKDNWRTSRLFARSDHRAEWCRPVKMCFIRVSFKVDCGYVLVYACAHLALSFSLPASELYTLQFTFVYCCRRYEYDKFIMLLYDVGRRLVCVWLLAQWIAFDWIIFGVFVCLFLPRSSLWVCARTNHNNNKNNKNKHNHRHSPPQTSTKSSVRAFGSVVCVCVCVCIIYIKYSRRNI